MIASPVDDKSSMDDTTTVVALPQYEPGPNPPPGLDQKVGHLQQLIQEYEATPNERITPAMVEEISTTMETLGQAHPDLRKRKSLLQKAKDFKNAPLTGGKAILRDFAVGFGMIVLIPFAVAGVGVAAAGGMMYGSGLFLKSLGGAMTFGLVGYRKKKETRERSAAPPPPVCSPPSLRWNLD